MRHATKSGLRIADGLIWAGAGLFLVALAVSAWVVPELRVLHVLQALLYVAVVVLARRGNVWGFGAGAVVALAWNGMNLVLTHLMQAGAVAFWWMLKTGDVRRLDRMLVLVGGVGHFVLAGGCVIGVLSRGSERRRWWEFAGGGVAALGYMALIIAIARPR